MDRASGYVQTNLHEHKRIPHFWLHKLVALSSFVYFTFGLATSLIYSFTVISLSLSLLLGLFRGAHISSLNLTFAALSLKFIRGHKPFLVFRVDREIIGLPYGQGQLSRIWKVQCDWLSLGKQCCSGLSRRLWGGTKHELL